MQFSALWNRDKPMPPATLHDSEPTTPPLLSADAAPGSLGLARAVAHQLLRAKNGAVAPSNANDDPRM
jgi:hypothetical protein